MAGSKPGIFKIDEDELITAFRSERSDRRYFCSHNGLSYTPKQCLLYMHRCSATADSSAGCNHFGSFLKNMSHTIKDF